MASQVEDGEFHPTGSSQENGPEPSVPIPQNESFNREQTVFLIDLIRHHLLNEGQGFPKTLYELNSRLKSAMGSRKVMWEDAAEQLSSHFMESFLPQRVARKWYTLVDGYTKARGLISAGKDSTRFQFYSEMDDILGNIVCEQHDEVYPVVVASEGRGMRIPKPQISLSSFKAFSKTAYKPSFSPYRGVHSPQFVPAAPVVQIQENEGFSREHILFLIDLMRQHIITEGEGLPKTLEELDERLKSAMANKKRLWEDASKQLSSQFMEYFYPDKIAKRWSSLVQGYKNVSDRDRITGQRNSMRFRFYSEMDELFDKQPDDALSAVVTTDAQEEARPETDAQNASETEASCSDASVLNNNPPTTGSCQETLDAALNLENIDSTFSQSVSPVPSFSQSDSIVPMEENESFTRDQTLFLIDLMRQLIENEGDGPPKTLKELNRRLKSFRGGKKELWKDTAEKMAAHFRKCFNPQRVARKWLTLIEAYTRVRENIAVKGTDSTRFHFYSEMDALMAEQHNLPLATGKPRVLKPTSVSRPCRRSGRVRAPANDEDEDYSPPIETPIQSPRKRRREEDDLLQFLREAEEANQRRHKETMVQLRSIQSLMTKLIDKL